MLETTERRLAEGVVGERAPARVRAVAAENPPSAGEGVAEIQALWEEGEVVVIPEPSAGEGGAELQA